MPVQSARIAACEVTSRVSGASAGAAHYRDPVPDGEVIRMLIDRQTDEQRLLDLLGERRFAEVKAELQTLRPADIADLFSDISIRDRVLVFRLLPKDLAIGVFEEIEPEDQRLLLEAFSDEYIATIVDEMSPDDRAELFDEMPAGITSKLMALISPSERTATANLLGYREDTAGRIMTPEYIRLRADMTAEQALRRIREIGLKKETIYYSYITDQYRRLVGVVSLRDLVLADSRDLVSELMNRDVIAVNTDQDREDVADLLSRYDLLAIPVIDREGRFVGIVTADDAADIIEEEATEDIQKLGAVQAIEVPYERAGVLFLWRKRIVWLFFLMVTGFLTSSVLAHYSDALQAVVVLAFFVPLLIGSGGNAGTQASTLMVRSLATGGVTLRDWLHILWREIRVGLALGAVLGTVMFFYSMAWLQTPSIGAVVALTMVGIVLWANLVGTLLPLILTKLKLDPAVASSPLVATLVDVTGLVLYFNLARLILRV